MIRVKTLLDLLTYGVALLGALPLFPWLAGPTRLVFAAGFCLGVWSDRRGRFPLRPGFISVLALSIFLFYILQIRRTEMLAPTINLLIQLMALRLLTPKEERHYLQIFTLAVFALAGSSLITLQVAFFGYLLLLLPALATGMLLLGFHAQDPELRLSPSDLRHILKVILALPACTLGGMFFFFLLLPRTDQPLWSFMTPRPAVAALSETVSPGALPPGSPRNGVVFRVRMDRQGAADLYWRGRVFDRLEGTSWSSSPLPRREEMEVVGGTEVSQEFYLEARGDTCLPALDFPAELTGVPLHHSPGGVFTALSSGRALHYAGVSRAGGIRKAVAPERQRYLHTPAPLSPSLLRVGRQLREEASTVRERIALLGTFFRRQNLTYSLDVPPLSADPLTDFLFRSRRGYCEHFASSFALLLRLGGVPARLVGGYYGGIYNDLGGYYLVTENQAHVWVEALDESGEWIRIDPVRFATYTESPLSSMEMGPSRALLDAFTLLWSQAVVRYEPGQLRERLRIAGVHLLDLSVTVLPHPLTKAGLLTMLLFLLLARWRRRKSREERLIHDFLARMRRVCGREIPSSAGLMEIAEEAGNRAAVEFVRRYGRMVYRDCPLDAKSYRALRRALRKIRPVGH